MKHYFCLQPAEFRLDGGAMFGIIPKPLWEKCCPPDESNRIKLALRLLLIRTERKNILIDTSIGDYHDQKFIERFDIQYQSQPHSLVASLKSAGLRPEDITDVVLTHLHFDHVGGLGHMQGSSIVPLFKKSVLHLHRDHYYYSQEATERDKGSFIKKYFGPLLQWYSDNNLIHWLDGHQGDILPPENGGLKFISSKGHTPYMIHPYDDGVLYLADIVPTSHHVSIPWVMGYDMAPGVSTINKKQILALAHEKNLTVIFEHDPQYWGAKIGKGTNDQLVCSKLYQAHQDNAYELKLE